MVRQVSKEWGNLDHLLIYDYRKQKKLCPHTCLWKFFIFLPIDEPKYSLVWKGRSVVSPWKLLLVGSKHTHQIDNIQTWPSDRQSPLSFWAFLTFWCEWISVDERGTTVWSIAWKTIYVSKWPRASISHLMQWCMRKKKQMECIN